MVAGPFQRTNAIIVSSKTKLSLVTYAAVTEQHIDGTLMASQCLSSIVTHAGR